METELFAELGEKSFQEYQEFERTAPLRGFVGGFAVQMAMTEPLTPVQAEQLTNALISATPAAENSPKLDPTKVEWAIVDRAAEQFLSPTQFAAWKLGVAQNMGGGSRLDQELKKPTKQRKRILITSPAVRLTVYRTSRRRRRKAVERVAPS